MSHHSDIETILNSELNPSRLDVINESYMHAVPPNSETHFKVVIVSEGFAGKRLVQRHQYVYGLLKEQLENGVHALALHTYTPDEWLAKGAAPDSPNCMGGSKHDK